MSEEAAGVTPARSDASASQSSDASGGTTTLELADVVALAGGAAPRHLTSAGWWPARAARSAGCLARLLVDVVDISSSP
eukprot:COSAG06_NODE_846_length_11978_cov_4.785420_8_plen_79_part_00